MIILASAIISGWLAAAIPTFMTNTRAAYGAEEMVIKLITSTFTFLVGSISRVVSGRICRLAIVWMVPIVMGTGLPHHVISIDFA